MTRTTKRVKLGGFEEHPSFLKSNGVCVGGVSVFTDDSKDGDMFVGDVPTLKPAEGIVWARVG